MKQIFPRVCIIALGYEPSLEFFPRMDEFGLRLGDRFADWGRLPNQLELRDLQSHRGMVFAHKKLALTRYWADGSAKSADEEIDFFVKAHDEVSDLIPGQKYQRLGLRLIFGLDFGHSFEESVSKIARRFHQRNESIEAIHGGKVFDVSYNMDMTVDDDWRCNLKIGPMKREQWFDIIGYNENFFVRSADSKYSLSELKGRVPRVIVYFDLDYFRKDVGVAEVDSCLRFACGRIRTSVKKFAEYYRG